MNNITDFQKKEKNIAYLSDEALEQLIAQVESEPLLHPPKEFQNEIFQKIHQKQKQKKERALFSYRLKVIAASAAALYLVFTVPHNISIPRDISISQDSAASSRISTTDSLNTQLNEYCRKVNWKLNQLVRMEGKENEKEKE